MCLSAGVYPHQSIIFAAHSDVLRTEALANTECNKRNKPIRENFSLQNKGKVVEYDSQ